MSLPLRGSLGDRMKANYEDRYRIMLPRRTYTVVRIDGRAFHTWTRGLERPYDKTFMTCMDTAALTLCIEAAGSEFAFVQSDEISLLLTDFRKPETAAWFDGNLQKMASICASVVTASFNFAVRETGLSKMQFAFFDARVFVVPDPVEVDNYFRWRQKDAERNSVSMLAQAYASAKQLHGKDRTAQHDLIHEAGDNWNDHPASFKRGRAIVYRDMQWIVDSETPVFTKEPEYLKAMIPAQWAEEVVPA